MLIDCDTCSVQGVHCHDCVITVLLNAPPQRFELDSDEQIAFVSLADAGLVPPLRLVPLRATPAGSRHAGHRVSCPTARRRNRRIAGLQMCGQCELWIVPAN